MADTVTEFDSLSPEDQKIAMALAGRQQASAPLTSSQNLALQGSVMRDPYAPVQHVPGEGLRAGMAAAQQNIANLPMRLAQGLGAQPGSAGELAGMTGSGVLNFATAPFGTPEGTAVAGALGPLRAGAQALPKLPVPNLLQTLGLGLAGGTAAGATGGNVTGGAAEGLAAGTVGTIFKRVSDMFAQKKEDALNLGKAIVKEVPWLEQLIPQHAKDTGAGKIGPLLAIRDPKVGEALLSTKFQQIKDEIVATVGKDTPIDIPALGAGQAGEIAKRVAGPTGGKLDPQTAQAIYTAAVSAGMFEPKTMTIETAFSELLKAKALARNAPDGAIGFTARERARQIQEQINQVIGVSDAVKTKAAGGQSADLLERYQDAMRQYGKGMAILDILGRSEVFQPTMRGGAVNFGTLTAYLNKHIDEYGPTRFPDLYRTATRGAPLGASDVQMRLRIPGLYGRGFSEHPGSIGITAPTGTLGAPQMGNPAAGLRPAMGSLMLPEWALQQPPGSQNQIGQ